MAGKPMSRNDLRSEEEYAMLLWLHESIRHGLVLDWLYEPKVFTLFDAVTYEEVVSLKTKEKTVLRHLHREETYTPDFWFKLSKEGSCALFEAFKPAILSGAVKDEIWIDVKGTYNPYQSDQQLFSMKQKAMYARYGIWVQKVIPFEKKAAGSLFKHTFAPDEFRWMKSRKEPTLTTCGNLCPDILTFLKMKGINNGDS